MLEIAADPATTVRGAIALLTGGRHGTDEDTLAVAAAVIVDAAHAGAIDVTGRKVMGIDRRRIVLGSNAHTEDALAGDVRRRVEIANQDTPLGWCERAAVFAEDAVAQELVRAGLATRIDVPWWKRLLRHRTLEVDPQAAADARARLEEPANAVDVAIGLILRETELLTELVGRRTSRKIDKRLDEDVLPPAARAVVASLRERRKRQDMIGTYAD